jgi:hypothetical protein
MSWKVCFLLALLLMLAMPLASAESGRELIENSSRNDGKTVSFRGEVIGVMIRDDFAWVNLLDNEGYAIGILCPAENAKKISFIGDYSHVGDNVQVAGTFHMACAEHGGDLDIHAENFTIVATGREVDRPTNLPIAALGVALMAVAILMTFYLRRIRKEKEKILPWPSY